MATSHAPDARMSSMELDGLTKDGLAAKIVGRVVDDAMRSGWEVTFKGDKEKEVTVEEAKEYNERLVNWCKAVKLKTRVTQHLKQARQYGGSLLVLGVADGQEPSDELEPEKAKSFEWLRAHDRHQVSVSSEVSHDPSAPGFGFPERYQLHSSHTMSTGRGSAQSVTMLDTEVHNSRVWRTDGPMLSDRVRLQHDGWGDSVLEASREPLSNFSSSMKTLPTIVQEWMQGVYKIKDLQGIVLANGDEAVRKRFDLMDYIKSAWNAVMVDTDNESFERQPASAQGLADILSWQGAHLSATSNQPMTLLFGISPSGFGTGESEGDNWDDTVKSFQTDYIEPLLEYVLGVLLQTPEFDDLPANWSIRFTSLQLTNPVEEADIRLKTSQADAIDITAGILGSDEVAESRYGGAAYSTETHLDEAARSMEAEAAESDLLGGGPAGDSEALNGIQITSLLEVLARVKTGLLPKGSAVPVLSASFPQMSLEQLQAMVDPIEVTGPIESEQAPPPTRASVVPKATTAPKDGAESTEKDAESDGDDG